MEDYIFILIAIALSVIGALNQKKKRQEQAMRGMDEGESKTRSVLEDIFDDDLFRFGEMEDNQVPPPIVKPAPRKKSKMAPPPKLEAPARMEYKPLVHESLRHSYVRPERKKKIVEMEVERLSREDEAKLSPKNLVLKDFSMRKAVIYSEIINRKY